MPLFKGEPFSLLEPPKDLDPKEDVYRIPLTNEIFRDFQLYQERRKLYGRNVWTCKLSRKTKLTFKQALESERNSKEKVKRLPRDLMAHVLRMTQYSPLGLHGLIDKIYASLKGKVFEGLMLHAKKDCSETPCTILKILDSGDSKVYEVGWLDQGKNVISTSVVKAADLIHRRAPVSRNVLSMCIRVSTSQSTPWIIHESLSAKHDISNEPPILYKKGLQNRGRKRRQDRTTEDERKKLKRDDLVVVVGPAADDPAVLEKLPLAVDFRVPNYSVGDLLVVWDFCLSFGRLLKLSPFSLTDLENAICHKESNVLLVEIHAAIFHLLIKNKCDYFTTLKNKKREFKVNLLTWAEYLCDFLEMTNIEELVSNIATVRRGYNSLIDSDVKLKILRELVEEAVTTSAIREILRERATEGKRHLAQNLETQDENLSIRSGPLGRDGHCRIYWFFGREGRLFVESADSKEWGYYSTKKELDALKDSLNVNCVRERALSQRLEELYSKISNALEKRTKDMARKVVVRRSPRIGTQPKDNPSMAFLKYVNKWKELSKDDNSSADGSA